MSQPARALPDLATTDPVTLTRVLCDIASVSGEERAIADAVEHALRAMPHLEVLRDGDAVLARTNRARASRVVIAGHLDTVPVQGNLPTQLRTDEVDGEVLWGRGTVDMKGGVAVALHLAAAVADPAVDVTYAFYDHEEVEAAKNGLGRIARNHPAWLAADFAILGEPTSGHVEGGCNGTMRLDVRTPGCTAHSARAWRGHNAIHDLAPVLTALAAHTSETVTVDGLDYREGLNAVGVRGGIAGNMIPDDAVVTVNYRFAPSRDAAQAEAYVREVLADALAALPDATVTVTDVAEGARPGLDHPVAAAFVAAATAATGAQINPKYGWTDVARFSALGVPAVNFGPGDPSLAHADDERVPTAQIAAVADALRAWLAP
ncbi:succinyl-diaminopimelate desuccinylase [Litorihabitans aurantiacus]|uniref:Succinyl-diaminopimelate desuccinylase n=1 Tax=Litorihabitans aurantiacus TaxID=1930061 RepID=A0AA38CT77_9MICO|nr:succinyl-diaminopimelate desuccinylase [Litorihabitans aurantiacus]GMA32154.1 succinyl-diaminopimelate desuccinylase [Litorihabitans aurantiacus]